VQDFETHRDLLRPEACRDNGARFSSERFRREVGEAFAATLAMHADKGPCAAAA
jgi:hypothetical protein